MRVLIDGYNLLFQSQLTGRGRGPGWLERARGRLIAFLQNRLTAELVDKTTIVFDASQANDASRGHSDSHGYVTERGLQVLFATGHDQADDLLEQLIRQHPTPRQLQVVSSDQRIRRCARARRAQSIDSESFLQALESAPAREPADGSSVDQNDDSPRLSPNEIDYWLREFGEL